jgi:3-deoxy-manno-octulosonate cytidylyltransferase (CMP-KDO synthetase)
VSVLAVVPVRMQSARFPGKPLADLAGRPLVQWVFEAASRCPAFDDVVVATDDEAIASRVRDFGGQVELTRSDHPSGTDRVAEVAERHPGAEVVVNVQGDLPFAGAEMLAALVEPYSSGEPPAMSTLASPFTDREAHANPNVVKVVLDLNGYALYFSRSPIPHSPDGAGGGYHHLGLYAFRRDALLEFPRLEPTPLERHERLEQLRALEHGMRIKVGLVRETVIEVNTPEDMEQARRQLAATGADR